MFKYLYQFEIHHWDKPNDVSLAERAGSEELFFTSITNVLGSVLGFLGVFLGLSYSFSQNYHDLDEASLYQLAKAEGQVVVYTFAGRLHRIREAFETNYPGVEMLVYEMTSSEQILRISSELDAGIANADVSYITDPPAVLEKLLAKGYLENYVPTFVQDYLIEEHKSPLLVHRLSSKVLLYNEAAYPEASPIDNLWQLTMPEWRSKVVMVDPLLRGDYLDLMTEFVLRADAMSLAYEEAFGKPLVLSQGARNAGEQFIIDLFANDLILLSSSDNVHAAVGDLQENPPVGFSSYANVRDNLANQRSLQLSNSSLPKAGISFPAYLAVVSNAPHPAAARLLINFMMQQDGPGVEPFRVTGEYLSRTDSMAAENTIPLQALNVWPIQPEITQKLRQQVADLILSLQ